MKMCLGSGIKIRLKGVDYMKMCLGSSVRLTLKGVDYNLNW